MKKTTPNKKIIFQKIGNVEDEILQDLKEQVERVFKPFFLPVKIADSSLSLLNSEYNREKRYYDALMLLDRIYTLAKKHGYFRTLGIINKDIFSKNRNDIVFGIARLPKAQKYKENGVALISLTQLKKKSFEKSKIKDTFLMRVSKEAIHELGHTFDLHHCNNECIMQFSDNITKSDRKPSTFCESCFSRLCEFFKQVE